MSFELTTNSLSLGLAVSVGDAPVVPLQVTAPAQPAVVLAVQAGAPANLQPVLDAIDAIPVADLSPVLAKLDTLAAPDLAPVLDAVAAIPAVDLAPVLAAVEAIPPVDLQPVLDAVAGIPTTDVVTGLATYNTAQSSDVLAAKTAVLNAIDAIPPTDLTPVLAAIDAIPAPDVTQTLVQYDAATSAAVAAAVAPLATRLQLDAVQTLLGTLGPQSGDQKLWSAAKPIPAGWRQVGGVPLQMPNGAFGLPAGSDPAASGGNYRAIVSCADGVHSFAMTSTVGSHYVLNESTGQFDLRTASPPFMPASSICTYPVATATADGGFMVFGGSSTTADTVSVYKFMPNGEGSGTWSQLANLPAGGWGGGVADVMDDGRIFFAPMQKRSGTAAVANGDTWLFYSPVTNTWAVQTSVGSIPTSPAALAAFGMAAVGSSTASCGSATVRLPSGKFAVLTNAAAASWYLIDPATLTFTLKTRLGPNYAGSGSGANNVWLGQAEGGLALLQGNNRVYFRYDEVSDTWLQLTGLYLQPVFIPTVGSSSIYIPKAAQSPSGLLYGAPSAGGSGCIVHLGGYQPVAAIYIEKL